MKQTKSISSIKIVGILFLLVIAKTNFAQSNINITFDVLTVNSGYNVSCYGMSDGAIDMTVFGEFPPFTFSWSNGATAEDLANIPAGTYTVTVTDDIGDWDTKTVTLHQPDIFSVTLDPSAYNGGYNISTMGGSNGTIKTTIHGGTSGYAYVWNTGSTDADLNAVTAGNYTVTVTDKNGCTATNHATLTQPTPLHIVSIVAANHNGHNLSCNSGHDGSIDLTVAGGATPYHYAWSNGAFIEDPTNLQAGQYMVQVTDANNATTQTQITLTAPAALSASLSTSSFNGYNISCNSCFNGTISTAVTGGTSGYTYSWASGQTSANLTALGVGSYSLTVTDANGCTTTATTALTEPANVGWDFGGNAIDSTKFIGSTNNAPLVFKTNGVERMRVGGNGDVTINNNATVNGTLTINNDLTIQKMYANRITSIPGDSIIHLGDSSINVNTGINRIYPSGIAPLVNNVIHRGLGIGWQTHGVGIYSLALGANSWASGSTSLTLGNNVRALGFRSIVIGSGSPTIAGAYLDNPIPNSLMVGFNSDVATLTVTSANGTSGSLGNVQIGRGMTKVTIGSLENSQTLNWSESYIGFNATRQSGGTWTSSSDLLGYSSANGGAVIYADAGGAISFSNLKSGAHATDPSTYTDADVLSGLAMRIDGNGNVGIGTDLSSNPIPGYKLAVNGGIRAKFLKVEPYWSDFVFEKKYKLATLENVEKYIKENGHLSDIPSNKEVMENGIDVGEMNAKLLQKIEELTLYIIDMQKQINELKSNK